MYIHNIVQLTSAKYLSLDHTFRIATNIGFMREDKKWISMYDSLFMVFNEEGKIMTWQLTNSTVFKNVEGLLMSLQHRLSDSSTLELISIDNCCQWCHKLQNIFGQHVRIVLDIFHAVQRVTKRMPKHHPYHWKCIQEFRLVFREKD